VAIVQARMASTRLPGKVLADIAGHPMLWHVLRRVGGSRLLDSVMVATTVDARDDAVVELARSAGVAVFRGSCDDVLDRYHRAAESAGAASVARITADCPLIDPAVIDRVLDAYLAREVDYASNGLPPTFPDGLDTEVFRVEALADSWREATLPSEREHVTRFIREHPQRYRLANVRHREDLSALRWTVDQPEDLAFVRSVFAALGCDEDGFAMETVLELVRGEPRLAVNAAIPRNQGLTESLRNDRLPGVRRR
jgi:spore coat polysaccharide biosynthesis protein SpsF